ncbi:hypothetical protein ACQKWADRAFT_40576 [Trichoderma austrokoningii]
MTETNTLEACPVRALRNSKGPGRGEPCSCKRHALTILRWQHAMIPPKPSFPPYSKTHTIGERRRSCRSTATARYKPVKQLVPAGCRRGPGHPCHVPETKSKGTRRSGSDMRRMFHRCIASGDDTGAALDKAWWPVSEQRLKEGSAKTARRHEQRSKYGRENNSVASMRAGVQPCVSAVRLERGHAD